MTRQAAPEPLGNAGLRSQVQWACLPCTHTTARHLPTGSNTSGECMCLSLLNQLSCQQLPSNLVVDDDIDRGLLLREAGLVVALRLQRPQGPSAGMVLRVLAITRRGRRVLREAWREPVENLP